MHRGGRREVCHQKPRTQAAGTPSAQKREGSDKQKALHNSSMGEERPIERTKPPCRRKGVTKTGTGAAAPRPIFGDHPVIIDLMQAGPDRLRSLDWKMAEILKVAVGAVRTIRPISANKIEPPTWINGIVEACHGKMEESVLQLVSQILLAAMDKIPGKQS